MVVGPAGTGVGVLTNAVADGGNGVGGSETQALASMSSTTRPRVVGRRW